MYSSEERNTYFVKTIEKLESSSLIDGIVQLGSGVTGYTDEHSDIDLMVSTPNIEDAASTKEFVRESLRDFTPLYIKEKQFSKDIFLIIAILKNRLEFNISIVPREFLSVKSPLWKIIFDRNGHVTEKMNREMDHFNSKPVKYTGNFDAAFEFSYCAFRLDKELQRNNVIYALKVLEEMRDYTLIVQAMNENKKLHQFKAYDTLNPTFKKAFLSTYPVGMTVEQLQISAEKLTQLFVKTVEQSSIYSIDHTLHQLMKPSLNAME
ncbi:hypothetical protein [Bacillus sp. AK031]